MLPVQWMKEQTKKQTNGQINKQTDKETNRQIKKQTKNKHKPYLNAGLKLDLCRDQKKHVASAVDERTDKETDKWTKGQINKQTDTEKERYDTVTYMNASLKLNLCRDEKKHVAGAVDERTHKETDKWTKNKQTNKETRTITWTNKQRN